MVDIYIGVAFLVAVIVTVFVDNLQKELVVKKANITKEVNFKRCCLLI